jgi:hypothetical protein
MGGNSFGAEHHGGESSGNKVSVNLFKRALTILTLWPFGICRVVMTRKSASALVSILF